MKLRKAASLLLATATAASFVLAGCGNSDAGSTADTTAAAESQATAEEGGVQAADKIIIFQSKVEIQDALEDCAEAFTEETGIEVEIWGTTGDGFLQQLKTKLGNDQGPTLYNLAPGSEVEQLQGYMADISDLDWLDTVADGMLDDVTIDGKVYGIPYTVEGFGIVYNKDLCDATTLTSTEDFVNLIKEQNEAGVEGFELSSEDYFLIGHILNTPFALQEDPAAFVADLEAGNVKMADNEIFQEFAEMMVAIRENCSNPLDQNYDGEIGDLATGKAAMIHQGNWCAGMFTDYEFTNAGLAPLPLAGNDKIAVGVPQYWAVNSMATAEEQEAAKQFLTWLYTSESGKNYLYNEFGFIPLIKGDVSENLDVLSQDLQTYVEAGKTITWANRMWPASSVNVYFAPLAQEFFTTDMSAADFLEALDNAYAEAVANQG